MGCGASSEGTSGGAGTNGIKYFKKVPSQYKLGHVLGEGGFGRVGVCIYKGKKHAIKMLEKYEMNHSTACLDEEPPPHGNKKMKCGCPMAPGRILIDGQLENFRDEVKTLEHVKGPNILEIVDAFETDHHFCIVTGLLQGGDLFERIIETEGLSEQKASILCRKMLECVALVHEKKVAHRDLKPENFVFESKDKSEESLTLIDFGAATIVDDNDEPGGSVWSTPYYAPEVRSENVKKTGKIWRAADLWSCGVIIYTVLVGMPPFFVADRSGELSESGTQKAISKAKFKWPAPDDGKFEYSKEVKDLVSKLIVKSTTKRWTARQALEHPWLKDPSAVSDVPLPDTVLTRMAGFRKISNLQNAVGAALLQRLGDAEKKKIFETFAKYDTDHDGIIDEKELQSMLEALGMSGPNQVAKVQSMMDHDGSGTITQEEFAAAVLAANMTAATQGELRAQFDLFDTDGNGTLSLKEISKIMPHVSADKIKALFTQADTDQDGSVSFAEWVEAMRGTN